MPSLLSLFRKRNDDPGAGMRATVGDVELPSFPTTLARVLPMLREDDCPTSEIAELLQHDPGLHVRVLRAVNSAAFGLTTTVHDIQRAVTLLGRARLETLVLAVAVKDALPKTSGAGFAEDRFWHSSARRASAARVLASRLHPATEAASFTAGLLQDVGVPVFVSANGRRYCEVYDRWRTDPGSELAALEREAFGCDHQTVGAMVADEWGLPEYLVRAIRGHHGDADADSRPEPAVRLVSCIRDDVDEWGRESLLESCDREFGIDAETATTMIATAFEHAEEFARALK